jgi:HEAT repeat protein
MMPERQRVVALFSVTCSLILLIVLGFLLRERVAEGWFACRLTSEALDVQRSAVRGLERLGNRRSVPALIRHARRLRHAFGLDELPRHGDAARLGWDDWDRIVKAIADIGGSAALRDLVQGMDDEFLISVLAISSSQVKEQPEHKEFLADYLRHPNDQVRYGAATALVRSQLPVSREAFDALARIAEADPDPLLKRIVGVKLGECPYPVEWTTPVFVRMLEGDELLLRYIAARNLTYTASEVKEVPVLREMALSALRRVIDVPGQAEEVTNTARSALSALTDD